MTRPIWQQKPAKAAPPPGMPPVGPSGISRPRASANIRPAVKHRDCWRLDHSGPMTWWGRPGDVKRCPHGHLMIRRQVPPNSRIAGPGTDYWETLHPILTPIRYQQAKKALS